MIEEDIAELKQQVLALQTALSLVLSPEHKKIVNTKDLRRTLKDMLKQDEKDAFAQMMAQRQMEAHQLAMQQQMEMERLRQQVGPSIGTDNTGLIGLGQGILDKFKY